MSISNLSIKNLLLFLVVISIYSCTKSENQVNEPDIFDKKLVGTWTVKSGATYAINDKGETITTATLKPNTFAHEFQANGKYIGHDYVSNKTEEGSWKLENKKQDGNDLLATLAVMTPSTKAQTGQLFVDNDGYQRFKIAITVQHMTMLSKEYEAYPYKRNWAEFFFTRL